MEAPTCDPVRDRMRMQPEVEQLRACDDPVLLLRKGPTLSRSPRVMLFVVHGLPNASLGADSPPQPSVRSFARAMPRDEKPRSVRGFRSTV
jgi:hypothetical protein